MARGGPNGLIKHRYIKITGDMIEEYRNTGGFDMIGSGHTKLDKPELFEAGLEILRALNITVVVIIGSDDSNTNAAILAEYYSLHICFARFVFVSITVD